MEFFLSFWGEGGDEPVVSHEEPGATDHSRVEWDVLFDQILSAIRTMSPKVYILLRNSVYFFNKRELSDDFHIFF